MPAAVAVVDRALHHGQREAVCESIAHAAGRSRLRKMATSWLLLLLASCALWLASCAKEQSSTAPVTAEAPSNMASTAPQGAANALPALTDSPATASATTGPAASAKTKVIAYINVTSGCQAETVNLLNKLGMDHASLVDMEVVDFGSPEGEERWRHDGLDCMAILFNGSPAVQFPDKDGHPKTVAFFMPAGFNWDHEDLQAAFAALEAGKLKILSEAEAQRELAPKPVDITVKVIETATSGELQINGVPVLTIKAKAGDKTPAQRARAAKAALEIWTQEPISPGDLIIVPKGEDTLILAGNSLIIQVTPADARKAGKATSKQVATDWLKALKSALLSAQRR